MVSQLRMYTIERGRLDDFVSGWVNGVRPLRERFGFRIDGAWIAQEESLFLWILSYDGPDDWQTRSRAYYDSAERAALEPDPARYILEITELFISPVPLST